MLLKVLLFIFVCLPPTFGIRCQCSTQKGVVPCYNGWCEVTNGGGKEGACGVVQKNNLRTLACVRVTFGRGDQCKVDKKNGQQQVRCWCRSGDYCNVDMLDRIDESVEVQEMISAEEVVTAPSTRLRPTTPKDDFVIDTAYEDERLTGVDYDDGDFSIEDTFPLDHPRPPIPSTLPPVQTARKTNEGPTVPPWRRVVPGEEDKDELTPPPLPETFRKQEERTVDRRPVVPITEEPKRTEPPRPDPRWEEAERRRIEWEAAWREHERRRTTTTTTTTTTTPRPTTTTTEPTTTSRRTTTTTTTPRPTTTTTRVPSSTTSTTTTTTKSTTTSTTATTTTTNPTELLLKFKEHQNEAKMSYEKLKHRYRPVDLFATSSTTSTTTTERPTTVVIKTRPTTQRTTTEQTTRRRTTTVLSTTRLFEEEEESREEESTSVEEEPTAETPFFKVYKYGKEEKKTTAIASCLLALLFAIVF